MTINRGAKGMGGIKPARRMTGLEMDFYNRDLPSLGLSGFRKRGREREQVADAYQAGEHLTDLSASQFHCLRIVSYAVLRLKTRSIASSRV